MVPPPGVGGVITGRTDRSRSFGQVFQQPGGFIAGAT